MRCEDAAAICHVYHTRSPAPIFVCVFLLLLSFNCFASYSMITGNLIHLEL